MRRHLFLVTSVALLALSSASVAQNNVKSFTPVTQEMLANPSADDWLMYSRTHDAQRFSPLNRSPGRMSASFARSSRRNWGRATGKHSDCATRACIYLARPAPASWRSMRRPARRSGSTSGRRAPAGRRRSPSTRTWCIYSSPDGFFVALDAAYRCGEMGNEIERQSHLWCDCRRRQGVIRARLWNRARQLLHLGARCENRKRSVALLYRAGGRRAGGRNMGRLASRRTAGVAVGIGGRLRSRAAADFLGDRQPDAEYPGGPPRRRRAGGSALVARGSLQQFDRRAQSRDRQARLVLPASAWRRLGPGLHERTRPGPDRRQSRSEVRQVDQSGYSPGPAA